MRVPKLRAVEIVMVPDERHGKALVLRDTEGVAAESVMVPGALAAVIGRFDGTRTVERIAAEATKQLGRPVAPSLVERLANELDVALFLDTPRAARARRKIVADFAASEVRPAHHAGGAYHGERRALADYIRGSCLDAANAGKGARPTKPPSARLGRMAALCAPHMDLWRAAKGYGHAYGALAENLSARSGAESLDTVVLLGTCHAPMREPFAICNKAFATPFGSLEPDRGAIAGLAAASRFDVFADEYLHKTEHSLEFQVVFLQYVLRTRERPVRIVPVLCGLGAQQARGTDPARDGDAESFIAALTELVARLGARGLVVAGADLAHVGPRFGDPRPLDDEERDALERRDGESIELARRFESRAFFEQVAADLDTRRVCGLAPIYTMLRVLGRPSLSSLLNYEQCVDPNEGSIVSHASIGFYA